MKKIATFIFLIIYVANCFLFMTSFDAKKTSDNEDLITESYATYKDGKKYGGMQIASHINVGEFADFNIVEDGGTHVDGKGNHVFSNYVVFDVQLNFDPSTKYIGDTDVKVSKDICDWNETPYSAAGDTEQYIAYGAISATKTDSSGNVFKYEPMFSKGNTSVEDLIFNEDGDYTVFVLFETVKNGKYQNHVLSWSFKIRSYIYLIDKETKFPIKESGISSKDVVLDYSGRSNIEIECVRSDGNRLQTINVSDGFILSAEGSVRHQYQFIVKCQGFICEKFTFYIDSINPTSQIYFENLRKQLSDFYYEAEEYFSITWTENPFNKLNVTYQYFGDNVNYSEKNPVLPEEKTYDMHTKLDQPGLYYIKGTTNTAKIEYWILVVEKDSPSYNYSVLSSERFNNFKTKWYEVYDDINERYLCFDVEEYGRAYDAAMTIENSSVSSSSGKYYYNNNWYDNRIDLTAAMNKYVFENNLKLVYFDPSYYSADEESERTFSGAAFDNRVYLNDGFQFVKLHYSETYTVVAIDENGKSYDLEFFVPISKQNLPNGVYTIVETDFYGNSTSYLAYRDKSAPNVTLTLNGYQVVANDGYVYSTEGGFSISEFDDEFDDFAVIKITKPDTTIIYYYQSEYLGIVFEQIGSYTISAYDRNGNAIEFIVENK